MRNEEPHLLNIPLDVLRRIMEFCVGVEYLKLRATCKHCQLAVPIKRLQTYSLNSPWLIVFDKHRGVITFTDPMFGDKYFIKTPQKLIGELRIYCSGYGWLLLYKLDGPGELFFYNPFTNDIRELPSGLPYLDSLYFLAPPTSPDLCTVLGLSASLPMNFYIYIWKSSSNWGALNIVLENEEGNNFWNAVVAKAPRRRFAQHILVSRDSHPLLVVLDELGEFVEVLRLNGYALKWEKLDSLGRYMIYICGTTSLCMEAKTPEMENKIYFPRLDSKHRKIVFYFLETRKYHTFNGQNVEQDLDDLFGTKYHVHPHAWIEPSWS
ncbi:F-box protein At3g56470-like [Bidens hawaiensis]|uniref:F-box protein At3g56470-like n=1 Tax=Bidens hawaiensis TaxID=980011 RepID=UPI0040497326